MGRNRELDEKRIWRPGTVQKLSNGIWVVHLNVLIRGDGWIRAGEPLLWVVDVMAGRIFVLANLISGLRGHEHLWGVWSEFS